MAKETQPEQKGVACFPKKGEVLGGQKPQQTRIYT